MIFSVLLNEWGGGQQLEGVDTKDVLSSLEKGKDQMEPGFGNGQVEDTKEEMARQEVRNRLAEADREVLSGLTCWLGLILM